MLGSVEGSIPRPQLAGPECTAGLQSSQLTCPTSLWACLQVERLQRKFAMIHSTLAQQQSNHKADGVDTPKLRHRCAAGMCVGRACADARGLHCSCRSLRGLCHDGVACNYLPSPLRWQSLSPRSIHRFCCCSEENPLNGLSRSGALPPGAAAAAKVSVAAGVLLEKGWLGACGTLHKPEHASQRPAAASTTPCLLP